MTQRHIITVSLESIKTKRQLKALFHDERLHVENTEVREGVETYRIPINKSLFVLEVRLHGLHLEMQTSRTIHRLLCCRMWTRPPTWCWTGPSKKPSQSPSPRLLPHPSRACAGTLPGSHGKRSTTR